MALLKAVALLAAVAFLTGCAAQLDHPSIPENASARWKKGDFSVVFRAGPKPFGEGKSYSSFEISRQFPEMSGPTTIVAESPQDIEWFRRSPKQRPSDFTKFFVSDSGMTLLIEETVPNEIAPCTNYILVRADEKDERGRQLDYQYLAFPAGKSVPGTIWREEAEVTKLTDSDITYRYRNGRVMTQPFKALTKPEQRPSFPG